MEQQVTEPGTVNGASEAGGAGGAGRVSSLYSHSLDIIRTNQAPSGAYIAGPNFPEYRYCWFRDGAYIAYSLDLAGEPESADRFYSWATGMIASRAEQVERVIATVSAGGMPAPEDLLHTRYTLDGELGPDGWPNFQLDGFGTLLWGLSEHLALSGGSLSDTSRAAVDLLARYLGALWGLPCYDCWEEFGDKVHTATLAAVYGGLNAAALLLGDDAPARSAAEIKAFVLSRCVVDGALCKFVGNPAVDASLLHVATPYRLLTPDDPLMKATVERIESELRQDGDGVRRYAQDSYYGGGEWVLLTAYLGWYYVECGKLDEARRLLGWVEGRAAKNGMLPEQVPEHLNYPGMLPVWEERWGPVASPLLWSHAAYITLSRHLAASAASAHSAASAASAASANSDSFAYSDGSGHAS